MFIFVQTVDLFIRCAPSKFTREVKDEDRLVMCFIKCEICPCKGEDVESELSKLFAALNCSPVLETIAFTAEVRCPKWKVVVASLELVEVDVWVFVLITVVRS